MRQRRFVLRLPFALTPPLRARSADMASDGMARVLALHSKAMELQQKGHREERAADLSGRAADAARELGEEDSLIVAALDSLTAGGLLHTAIDPTSAAARSAQRAYIRLISRSMEALGRRRAAGMLLKGQCRASEEAWQVSSMRLFDKNNNMTAATIAFWAPLVGYVVHLHSAAMALNVLFFPRQLGVHCTAAQRRAFFAGFVATAAADLAQRPRGNGTRGISGETAFVISLRNLLGRIVAPLRSSMLTWLNCSPRRGRAYSAAACWRHAASTTVCSRRYVVLANSALQ
jgi:hypothetical protein